MSGNHAETRRFAAVAVGDELPVLTLDITTALIVGGALASRDYQNVHHDKAAAQALGSPDIFMNILTTNGLVGRFATDWAGPEAMLRSVRIKLGVPNYPGDKMKLSGQVSAKRCDAGGQCVDIDIKGTNGLGLHVTGAVTIALP